MATSENKIVVAQEDQLQEKEEREDYFNRLPDELIISHIFGKIPDAKSLFLCFILSKRLGFLVLQSQTISCTIHGWLPFDIGDEISVLTYQLMSVPQKLLCSLKKPFQFLHSLFPNSPPSLYDKASTFPFLHFIRAFQSLKSLSVEVAFSSKMKSFASLIECPNNIPNHPVGPVVKWKGEFNIQSSGSFVLFLAEGLSPLAAGEDGNHKDQDADHDEEQQLMTPQQAYEHLCIFKNAVRDAKFRLFLFERVAPLLGNQLQSLVVTDSWKQGKVVLGEEKLAEVRCKNTSRRSLGTHENIGKIMVWSGSVVRLPLSGYVMKRVTLFSLKVGAAYDGRDVECIARDAFDGEGKVFAEAVTKMLKKPATMQQLAVPF